MGKRRKVESGFRAFFLSSLVSLIRSCFLLGARLVRMIIMTYAQVACQSHDWGRMLRTKGWGMYRID